MMQGLRRAAALLAVLGMGLVAGCLSITETQPAELVVQVVDQTGAPMAGARVEPFGGWFWNSPRAIGITDAAGQVRLSLPPATYKVDVYPPEESHRPFIHQVSVQLDEGDRGDLRFVFNVPAPDPEP